MRRHTAAVSALLLMVLVGACGKADHGSAAPGSTSSSTASPTTATTSTTAGHGHPAPSDPVITIASGGGFVPSGTDFAAVALKVLRDGTVLTGGPIPLVYPGPAVNPVVTGKLSDNDLPRLLADAKDAGVGRDHLDAGQPAVTDQPTTSITVELDGSTHHQSVYALDAGSGPTGSSGLTPAQVKVRQAIAAFVSHARQLGQQAARQPYVPTGYQVLASQADPTTADTGQPRPSHLDWPLRIPTGGLSAGDCFDVTGPDAPVLARALAAASATTIWRDAAGANWHLSVRVTLPGDEPCPTPP